jgi:hypothetical protein
MFYYEHMFICLGYSGACVFIMFYYEHELYEKFFKGKLLLFAVHPVGNFILQRVITNVKEKEHVRFL